MCSRVQFRTVAMVSAVVWSALVTGTAPLRAEQPATGKPPLRSPLSAEESLAHFHLETGLRIEIAAAEPEVIDPVAVAFDEDGRMWVVEMGDYPRGPQPAHCCSRPRI